ncbi:MAG: PQQ-dependent sugar dehydrogenase [Rhodothermaceae bacterium]|nr:PQQ-dependent sugar dehydrogenase [Rhodothermaceae bacterium]
MSISQSSSLRFVFLLVLSVFFIHPAFAQVQVDEAFPPLNFSRPIDLQNADDGTDRLFVAEQQEGRIWVFANDPAVQSASVFLDISDRIRTNGNEEGLLGLVFHPDFATNGYFYVYYSASSPRRTIVERFEVSSDDPNVADIESGLVIIEISQPYDNHNGGQLAFGPADGYLYIAVGDGGSGGDPQGHGQNRETLLGNILRIDVDGVANGLNYQIPPDNPYVGNGQNFREEIYAYGFRNPWRMSFDAPTGQLWVGDVGQSAREEVGVVDLGENHGWNTMEGFLCFPSSTECDPSGLTLPVWDYGRSLGQSVSGGHVYRGSRAPEYDGFYFYADFATGRLWALRYIEGQPVTHFELVNLPYNVSSFGVDESGELYLLSFNGNIYNFLSVGLPVVWFESGPLGGSSVSTSSVSFSWNSADSDGSIVDYEAVLTGPTSYDEVTTSTSITLDGLANGSYSFCLRTRDDADLVSLQACSSFEIEANSAPTVQIEEGPADGSTVNDEQVRFAWSGSDPNGSIALYEYDLSGPLSETSETTDTEATFEPLTNGAYSFCVRAQDNEGLWSPQECVDFSVDLSVADLTPPIDAFLNGTLPPFTPDDTGDPDRTAPLLLSEIDAFSNMATLEVVDGVLPYDLIQPFWSDGALKNRWMAIPTDGTPDSPDEQIGYSEEGNWSFPVGTVFVKHFEIALDETADDSERRLETRFFVHGEDETWYGLTYRWRPDHTDADLVGSSGSTETLSITTAVGTREQTWYYPSRIDCQGCHSTNAGSVLGPKSRQLNHEAYYPDIDEQNNQLVELQERGFINTDPIDTGTLLTLTPLSDTEASVEDRMRSYLDVNCAYCHQEGGTGKGFFDARYPLSPDNQNIVDGTVIDEMGITGARVIAPGDTSRSTAYIRMTSLFEEVMMPPLAKNRVDTAAISLMRDWIVLLGELPVELTRFEGQVDENTVHLSWTTASEKNNAGFSIERQLNHGSVHDLTPDRWAAIGFVNGKGTTNTSSDYTYQDMDIPSSGTSVFYRLKQVDFDGTTAYSEIVSLDLLGPTQYALHDNYPNPFNPSTTIVYDIPVESHVELSVYDAQGRLIEVLVDQSQKAGQYTIAFEPEGLVTGMYFYRIKAGEFEETGQMLFVK